MGPHSMQLYTQLPKTNRGAACSLFLFPHTGLEQGNMTPKFPCWCLPGNPGGTEHYPRSQRQASQQGKRGGEAAVSAGQSTTLSKGGKRPAASLHLDHLVAAGGGRKEALVRPPRSGQSLSSLKATTGGGGFGKRPSVSLSSAESLGKQITMRMGGRKEERRKSINGEEYSIEGAMLCVNKHLLFVLLYCTFL
jgi:hypothetical protein